MTLEERKARIVRMRAEELRLVRELRELRYLIKDEEALVQMLEKPKGY